MDPLPGFTDNQMVGSGAPPFVVFESWDGAFKVPFALRFSLAHLESTQADVAQLVEQPIRNRQVSGSSPLVGSTPISIRRKEIPNHRGHLNGGLGLTLVSVRAFTHRLAWIAQDVAQIRKQNWAASIGLWMSQSEKSKLQRRTD